MHPVSSTRRFTRERIEAIYRAHPLRLETILRRVLRDRGSLDGVTEIDLAEDPATGLSDHNHRGGLASTRELARHAGISSTSRVLDIGCGLGGSARAIAMLHGCQVHGIDVSPERVRDARELTSLVGLTALVTFECADVHSAPLPSQRFDVLWGQDAWSHFEDKGDFLRKWTRVLAEEGTIAVEDVCLLRAPATDSERELIRALEDHWTSYLAPLDGPGGWHTVIEDCGFVSRHAEDCSAALLTHFVALRDGAARSPEPVNQFEQNAWSLAIQAAAASLLGAFRTVASRHEDIHP